MTKRERQRLAREWFGLMFGLLYKVYGDPNPEGHNSWYRRAIAPRMNLTVDQS